MNTSSPILLIEINKFEFIFVAVNETDSGNFKILYKNFVQMEGISNNKISDFEKLNNLFKKNIYLIEKKLNFTFKEAIIIIDNFEYLLTSLSGFKNLNGSQLVKENITFILNSIKFKINEFEKNKTILHIFNSKFLLDKKEIENLPIGLFGDFYSHELSFFLINNNDFKNLENILNSCNLKLKKIISKSFVEGVNIINNNLNLETFFKIEINDMNSKILYFENSALKFLQEFQFGSEIVIKDISKILNLQSDVVKNILKNSNFSNENLEKDFLEKEYFNDKNFRKIKKKLIIDIANARIKEISDIILIKNINTSSFLKPDIPIFLKINEDFDNFFISSYELFFSNKNNFKINILEKNFFDDLYSNANRIVQYGWKKEALPIIQEKKSIIARIFNLIFN
tara:strand:- start:1874 stop:3067 length:1194 start_codon:yes stop_codon:yes gene_type:complete